MYLLLMIVIAVHIDANENVGVASIDCCVLMFQSNQAYLNRDLYTRLQIKISISLKTPETHGGIQPKIIQFVSHFLLLFLYFASIHWNLSRKIIMYAYRKQIF